MATRSRFSWGGAVALLAIPAFSAAAAPRGDVAAGQFLFANKCACCHTIERLAGLGGLVGNDMRKIDPRMATLGLLWDADLANLRAYLNSVPAPRPRE
jgi:mono/diheme cytochrome c family protein